MKVSPLPKGWRLVKFGDLVRKINDRVDPDSSGISRYVAGEHMDSDNLKITRWGTVGDGYLGPAFTMRFQPGQILYGSRRTYLRKVAVADFVGICANTTFVLESKSEELLQEFLPHVMSTERFHEYSISKSKGSVNPYINFVDLNDYEFALPPIAEQRRIIKLMLTIDENINHLLHLDCVISKSKRSIFNAGIKGRSTVTSIAWGEVSSDIPVVKLGSICAITRGSSPRPKGDPRYFSISRTPHHWIMIADLARSKRGKFLTDTAQFLTAAGVEKSRKVEPGTLLLTNCATVGVPVFSGISGCVHDGFLLFDPQEEKLSKEFLFRLFEYLTEWFPSISQTGTQANLNTGILKELEIPLLSIDAQKDIVDQLDGLDSLFQANEIQLSSLRALRTVLLSGVLENQGSNV